MSVSLFDVQIGKYYHFFAENDILFAATEGIVTDFEKNFDIKIKNPSGETIVLNAQRQTYIFADPILKENNSFIESQIQEIVDYFSTEIQDSDTTQYYTYENDALDGLEEKEDVNAASFYIQNGFPENVLNTVPYVLRRKHTNRLAFNLLLYAMVYCVNHKEKHVECFLPIFPNQNDLFAKENVEVLRRAGRFFREQNRQNPSKCPDLRFKGVITSFNGDHGWITVSDRFSIKYNRESILDINLLSILTQGITVSGWIEVEFSISRTESGHYACRIKQTLPSSYLTRQLYGNLYSKDCDLDIPEGYREHPICSRGNMPPQLQDILKASDLSIFQIGKTRTGIIISYSPQIKKGIISSEGNLFCFYHDQVCDLRLIKLLSEERFQNTEIVFEPAYNALEARDFIGADFVRLKDFSISIPQPKLFSGQWPESIYSDEELTGFLNQPEVNKSYAPLQPWVNCLKWHIGESETGRISPSSSKQKGWIFIKNGWRYGFSYSQIQDELLYVVINSSLRLKLDWSRIDVSFTIKRVNEQNIADSVILTNAGRTELVKQSGISLPTLKNSIFYPLSIREAFVPIESNLNEQVTGLEVSARIIGFYNKKIKLSVATKGEVEEYEIPDQMDSCLKKALETNKWYDVNVTYKRCILQNGMFYPYDLKPTKECMDLLRGIVSAPYEKNSVEKKAPSTIEKDTSETKSDYGILLPTSLESSRGYIGKDYYTLACDLDSYPDGDAFYEKEILPFEIDSQYVYIVKYDYKAGKGILRNAQKIDYVDKTPYEKLGSLHVKDDGTFSIISFYSVAARYYLYKEVLVTCKTGEKIGGQVVHFDKESLSVNSQKSPHQMIHFSEIEDIDIFGTLRPYNETNATGKIDQFFFFNLENLVYPAEATMLHEGVPIKYRLRGVRKRFGVEAGSISIIRFAYLECYVVGKTSSSDYQIINKNSYGIDFDPEIETITVENVPETIDLSVSDYHVTLKRRDQDSHWLWDDKKIERIPKQCRGVITEYDNEKKTVRILEKFDEHKEINTYTITDDSINTIEARPQKTLMTSTNDYDVLFTKIKRIDGNIYAHIIGISEAKQKRLIGEFVFVKTYDYGTIGYIVEEKNISVPFSTRKEQGLDYSFRYEEIRNPSESIRTDREKYIVTFIGKTNYQNKKIATDIEIIRIVPKYSQNNQGHNLYQQNQESSSIPRDDRGEEEQIVNLVEKFGKKPDEHFAILRGINPLYNMIKLYLSYDHGLKPNEVIDNQPTAIGNTELTFKGENIKSSYVYLVKYKATPSELSYFTINDDDPVEVLAQYKKKGISLRINNDSLYIKQKTGNTSSTISLVVQGDLPDEIKDTYTDVVPDYLKGESLYIVEANNVRSIQRFDKSITKTKIVTDRSEVSTESCTVWRFGIITNFDETFSWGILNDEVWFSLSLMEQKSYNMLRTAKRQMLVIYTCSEDRITTVERCDDRVQSLLQWREGTVESYIDSPEKKSRILMLKSNSDSNIQYLMATTTDSYVSQCIKNDVITNKQIYYRNIYAPLNEGLVVIATDVHLTSEPDQLITYDPENGTYYAVRNATWKEELYGSAEVLSTYVGEKVEIVFSVEGTRIIAGIAAAGGADEYDDADLTGNAIPDVFHTELALFLEKTLHASDYYSIAFEKAISTILRLNKDNKAKSNFLIAFAAKNKGDINFTFKMDGLIVSASACIIRGYRYKLKDIPARLVFQADEYSYYGLEEANALISSHNLHAPSVLYRIFQADFCGISDIRSFETKMHSKHKDVFIKTITPKRLVDLFSRKVKDADTLISHLLRIDTELRELIFEEILPLCPDFSSEIISWSNNNINNQTQFHNTKINAIWDSIEREYRKVKRTIHSRISLYQLRGLMFDSIYPFVCSTDKERLRTFSIINKLVNSDRYQGYEEYRSSLHKSLDMIKELIEDIEQSPTPEAVELLYNTSLLFNLREKTVDILNNLYANESNAPIITCVCNEQFIPLKGQVILRISNDVNARQDALDVAVELESYDSGEIQVNKKLTISGTNNTYIFDRLAPASHALFVANIIIDDDYPPDKIIKLSYTVEYKRNIGISKTGKVDTGSERITGDISLHLATEDNRVDKTNAQNPYLRLTSSTIEPGDEMFYGREKEINAIQEKILDKNNRFVSSSRIMIYGSKKCGKTSLMTRVTDILLSRERSQQRAIIITWPEFIHDVGFEIYPDKFIQAFYGSFLDSLRQSIMDEYPDLYDELEESDKLPPESYEYDQSLARRVFDSYIDKFYHDYSGHYQIMLVMDEFTAWITTISRVYKDEYNKGNEFDARNILNSLLFIKHLSDKGIIQIIVGHDNMRRAISELGKYNQIAQFALPINVFVFNSDDARMLIRQPMIHAFHFDPYDSTSGIDAIAQIERISGNSPYVLMYLLSAIFDRYKVTDTRYITDFDVIETAQALIKDDSKIHLQFFNFLYEEDGDEIVPDEERKTFKYLKHIALNSDERKGCDADLPCPGLSLDEQNSVKQILWDRQIITNEHNVVRIKVDLFRLYINYRYGNNLQ